MSPAEELRQGAFALRNPCHQPTPGVDTDVAEPLANWLDQTADLLDAFPALVATTHALAVARAINGGTPQ